MNYQYVFMLQFQNRRTKWKKQDQELKLQKLQQQINAVAKSDEGSAAVVSGTTEDVGDVEDEDLGTVSSPENVEQTSGYCVDKVVSDKELINGDAKDCNNKDDYCKSD